MCRKVCQRSCPQAAGPAYAFSTKLSLRLRCSRRGNGSLVMFQDCLVITLCWHPNKRVKHFSTLCCLGFSFSYEFSETKLFNISHKEAMQIPHNMQSNKSIIKCYYSQNKCESKQMSVGGLVGLGAMEASGKTTTSAFLIDDGLICNFLPH